MTAASFAAKARANEPVVGYWVVLDSPVSTERVARLGYDYVALDAQHGLMGYSGWLHGLMAIDAAGAAGIVRVPSNNAAFIGQALDAGAAGVIVPLVNNAEEAAAAVRAVRYPPHGMRSYGPMRSALRIGPVPAEADATVLCLAMIETPEGLENVKEICAVPGIDGVYIGPSDLCLAVGGKFPNDPDVAEEFNAALVTIREAAQAAGVIAAIHTASGEIARQRIAEGFTFVTVASDLTHLEIAAANHLSRARGE
ncbi:aldolase [Pseudarthrobacter sp. NIBRBAC000502772]|uniref:HpcH/HpaI aldolase family protein n=1 Tax=Pseudarthrobacter sp. NIBRBAC000502772 TaxID=2590775 RepID=UPI001130AB43|nr:aldolase/citrate lyase family protein [Pseudarthrobacter sp. NIBRBAC000502772]QDG66126.1 aldolase [Pseudarthrobacter sp. NIBRBAC000502772]